MFLGSTSSRSFSSSCRRRQRLRSAMATARLASFWPTMKRSSSETISRGEKSVIVYASLAAGLPCADGVDRMHQHEDVQSQIIPDHIAYNQLHGDGRPDHRRYRKPARQHKAHDHAETVGQGIDHAVAVVLQRN